MEQQEIKDQLTAIREQNETIMQRTEFIATKMEEYTKRFENLEHRVDTIEHRVDTVEKEHEDYDHQFNYMKEEMNNIKQAQLELNLLINGMPEYNEEKQDQTLFLVKTLLSHLKLDIDTSVASAKRIGTKSGSKPRPILLKMSSRYHKEALLNAKKGKKSHQQCFSTQTHQATTSTSTSS